MRTINSRPVGKVTLRLSATGPKWGASYRRVLTIPHVGQHTHTQTKVDIKKGESRNKANTGLANPMRTRDASLSCQPVYPAPSYAAGYIKGLRGLKLMLASRKGLKGTGQRGVCVIQIFRLGNKEKFICLPKC